MSETEVREQWGETLASLAVEREVVITSGDRVVARLVAEDEPPRKRFDPEEMRRWRQEVWGDKTFDTLTPLMEDREERVLISDSVLSTDKRPTFDWEAHEAWLNDFWGNERIDSLKGLMEDREDRKL